MWKRGRNSFFQSNSKEARAARTCDNIEFDSLAEMYRYKIHLKPLLSFGHIKNLEFQPRFYLDVLGHRLGFYTADFMYSCNGEIIVEEIKGNKENREFSIKWKLVQLLHPEIKFVYIRAVKNGIRFNFSIKKRTAKKIKTPQTSRGN